MIDHLCTAPHCHVRGEHTDDCTDPKTCTGCRPDVPVFGTAFCQRCTDRLAGWLTDVPDLFDEVVSPPDATNTATAELGAVDPITASLPAGAVPGPSHNPRVSGSPEGQIAARYVEAAGGTTTLQRDRAGRLYASDQVGDPPPAVVLDSWCRDWASVRGMDEYLPDPTVANLCCWLGDRLPDALRSPYPDLLSFYTEIHSMHSRLWVEAGRTEPKAEPCVGVPCKRCDRRDLWRTVDGSGDIECHTPDCRRVYRRSEFDEWTRLVSGPAYRDWLKAKALREKADPVKITVTTEHMYAWSDGRRAEIIAWARANGLVPENVVAATGLTIERGQIHYHEFDRDAGGNVQIDDDKASMTVVSVHDGAPVEVDAVKSTPRISRLVVPFPGDPDDVGEDAA